jgi:hypothetical protein
MQWDRFPLYSSGRAVESICGSSTIEQLPLPAEHISKRSVVRYTFWTVPFTLFTNIWCNNRLVAALWTSNESFISAKTNQLQEFGIVTSTSRTGSPSAIRLTVIRVSQVLPDKLARVALHGDWLILVFENGTRIFLAMPSVAFQHCSRCSLSGNIGIWDSSGTIQEYTDEVYYDTNKHVLKGNSKCMSCFNFLILTCCTKYFTYSTVVTALQMSANHKWMWSGMRDGGLHALGFERDQSCLAYLPAMWLPESDSFLPT